MTFPKLRSTKNEKNRGVPGPLTQNETFVTMNTSETEFKYHDNRVNPGTNYAIYIIKLFFKTIPRAVCSTIIICCSLLCFYEYHRLMIRASMFHKRWNPIIETWDEFYESEKKIAKNILFKQWHGASTFYDWIKEDNQQSPNLRELLTSKSRNPFSKPLEATRASPKPSSSSSSSFITQPPPTQRSIGDVTLILNHFKRNTLQEQLNAILISSVLPKEIWICLFNCGYDRETIYRKQVAQFLLRYKEQGSNLHIISSDFNFKYFGRFQLALQAPTAYVWVVDDDVIPGARFLEILLHVGGSSLTFGALGATGWLFPPSPSDVNQGGVLTNYRDPSISGGLYIPDDRYNLTVTKLTETDILCSQWFLRTPLVPLLFRERPPTFETGEDFLLSYALRKFAGLPSYVLPCALHNIETWGNVDISKHTLSKQFPQNNMNNFNSVTPKLRTTSSTPVSSTPMGFKDETSVAGTTTDMVTVRNEVWGKLLGRGAIPLRTVLRNSPGAMQRRDKGQRHINLKETLGSSSSSSSSGSIPSIPVYDDDDVVDDDKLKDIDNWDCSVLMAISSLLDAQALLDAYSALTDANCAVFLVVAVDHPHKDFASFNDHSKIMHTSSSSLHPSSSFNGPPSVLRLRGGSTASGDDFADDDEINENNANHVAFSSGSFGGSLGLGVSGFGGGGGLERAAYHLAATWANNEMSKDETIPSSSNTDGIISKTNRLRNHFQSPPPPSSSSSSSSSLSSDSFRLDNQRRRNTDETLPLSCLDLMSALNAPKVRCAPDRFGTFRVRKPRQRAPISSSSSSSSSPKTPLKFEDMYQELARISTNQKRWASGGFTGFGDALTTSFSVASKLKPSALVWWSPSREQLSEPLIEAFELLSDHIAQSTISANSKQQNPIPNPEIESALSSLLVREDGVHSAPTGALVVKYLTAGQISSQLPISASI